MDLLLLQHRPRNKRLSSAGEALTPQAGGEIVVAYKDDLATLDPAIGYDWTNWPAIKMVFDGLLGYDSGTTLEPRIAADMPAVSDDGLVYTFKIRPGVKFSNGREVTADDVVYTITRVLDPATASPGAGFYVGIKGAQEFIDGSATSVEGIKAVDPQTVEFTLATPDATFLNKMALNFAFIVAKEAVEAAGQDFGRQPVGTGPFTLKEWKSGEYLVFERNPNYFQRGAALPGQDHHPGRRRAERGRAAAGEGRHSADGRPAAGRRVGTHHS